MSALRVTFFGIVVLLLASCGQIVTENLPVSQPPADAGPGASQTVVVLPFADYSKGDDVEVAYKRNLMIMEALTDQLTAQENEQANELLKMQTADYKAFIQEYVELSEIMTKKFYIIVTYDPLSNKKKSFFSRFKEVLKPVVSVRLKEEAFQRRKKDLDLRVANVAAGLKSMGLNVIQLDTQALIELYYSTYNPDISFVEPVGDISKIQVEG